MKYSEQISTQVNPEVKETKIKVTVEMPNFKLLQAKRRNSCPILIIAPSNPNKFNIYDKEYISKNLQVNNLRKKLSLIPPAYYTYQELEVPEVDSKLDYSVQYET